jgi:transcriptional regulator with XRE-family HTH domain
LLPGTELRLQRLGERLRLGCLRRRLTGKQVAERAGMTPVTLRSLERGSSGVTIGAYLAVMQVLGAEKDLDLLLKDDPLGRNLQDAALPNPQRAPTQVAHL